MSTVLDTLITDRAEVQTLQQIWIRSMQIISALTG